jgi:predicted TIM-barrel fold metal-dependent hydrolase
MLQDFAPSSALKASVSEIEGYDIEGLLRRLDAESITRFQTMPQEMTRVQDQWLGSNQLSADIQRSAPDRIVAFAAAEPLDRASALNRARLAEVERAVREDGLQGLLLTPPYGHYYSNDKRVYPFYELAVQLGIPVYFHHSHMFGPSRSCPLKYARIWLLDDLTIDFPDLRFNVEHMGYPWTEVLLSIMARSPNVYTDIAMFIGLDEKKARPLLLARNLGMAREYGVLDRVFYGSDYVGEDVDEYLGLLRAELDHIVNRLGADMARLGYPPITDAELEGLLSANVQRLWG